MTISYPPTVPVVTAVLAFVLADFAGWTPVGVVGGAGIAALSIGGGVLWIYSPLPDSNGSLGASRGWAGFWGFTEPEDSDV